SRQICDCPGRGGGSRTIVKTKMVRVAELHVIEDVEELDAEFEAEAFRKLRFLHQRHIDLPGVEGTDDAVAGISKMREQAGYRIDRRRLEGIGVNQRNTI